MHTSMLLHFVVLLVVDIFSYGLFTLILMGAYIYFTCSYLLNFNLFLFFLCGRKLIRGFFLSLEFKKEEGVVV